MAERYGCDSLIFIAVPQAVRLHIPATGNTQLVCARVCVGIAADADEVHERAGRSDVYLHVRAALAYCGFQISL